jgi:hypothetical protein
VPEPIWVLDPATSFRCWEPLGQEAGSWGRQEATLGADGCTLTMSFLGSPPAYPSYPAARVLESGNAVALIPDRTELVTGARTAVGIMRQVTALWTGRSVTVSCSTTQVHQSWRRQVSPSSMYRGS